MTGDGHVLKDATFEAMEVGEELGPIELVVDDHAIKQFAFTWPRTTTRGSSAASRPSASVAHAAIPAAILFRLLNTRYDPNTEVGLHQGGDLVVARAAR